MKSCPISFLFDKLLLLFLGYLSAATSVSAATALTDEDLLLSRCPVIIQSRLLVGGEHTDTAGGGHRQKFKVGAAYGFGFGGEDRNFGVGIEWPYLLNEPNVGDSGSGVGDFKVRVGQIFTGLPEGWRAGWYVETEFDTAASEVFAIANQRPQMAAGGGAVMPITDRLAMTVSLAYGWSLENGLTSGRKAEWEAHWTTTWKLLERTSVSLDYKAILRTVAGNEVFQALEPGFGINLGKANEYGLFGSVEIPLQQNGTNWVAKCGLTRFF